MTASAPTPTLAEPIDRDSFLHLEEASIAGLARASGRTSVCVFPMHGSRRWLLSEYGPAMRHAPLQARLDLIGKRQIALFEMFFAHGLETLVVPLVNAGLLSSDEERTQEVVAGLLRLATHPDFLAFYRRQNVRVYFYGQYRTLLANSPLAYLVSSLDQLSRHTARHTGRRIFFGLMSADPCQVIAEMAVRFHQQNGRVPSQQELAGQYYGENITRADLVIGSGRFSTVDYPILGDGQESLYFTAAPSLFLEQGQLRAILFDHLNQRPLSQPDYDNLTDQDIRNLRARYHTGKQTILGLGEIDAGIWHPHA